MIKKTSANVKCTFNLVLFFSFSVPALFFKPSISMQKHEVSEVIAPSTLGNKCRDQCNNKNNTDRTTECLA